MIVKSLSSLLLESVKNDIIDLLDTTIVTFVFRKKDGRFRTIKGTRNTSIIPAEDYPYGINRPNPPVYAVYDLDKMSWRRFDMRRLSTILTYVEKGKVLNY
jgi:hypothetical protein